MTKEIDGDLFVRLMQMSAPARKELLEYIGQGPVSSEPIKAVVSSYEKHGQSHRSHCSAKHRR